MCARSWGDSLGVASALGARVRWKLPDLLWSPAGLSPGEKGQIGFGSLLFYPSHSCWHSCIYPLTRGRTRKAPPNRCRMPSSSAVCGIQAHRCHGHPPAAGVSSCCKSCLGVTGLFHSYSQVEQMVEVGLVWKSYKGDIVWENFLVCTKK